MPALFIVLEGPDGAGTTTQCRLLEERLRNEGHDVLLTAEPTDGPIGTWIRSQLKNGKPVPSIALQLLFCADRAWHIDEVIKPALNAGKIVICDRYSPSTIIYANAQEMDIGMLEILNNDFIQPDLLVFTLPPVDVSLARLKERTESDYFEKENLQRRIHAGYSEMAAKNKKILVVDTSGTKTGAANVIYATMMKFL